MKIERVTDRGEVLLSRGYFAGVVVKRDGPGWVSVCWQAIPFGDTTNRRGSKRHFETQAEAANCVARCYDGGLFRDQFEGATQ